MVSLYQDDRARAACGESLLELIRDEPGSFDHWIAFLEDLLRQTYAALGEGIHQTDPHQALPPLVIYPDDDPANGMDLYMDAQGVHAGLGLFISLQGNLLRFTRFLMENFIWQICPIVGDAPRLADVVTLEDFPRQALMFHAASLMPEAVTRDGYARSPGSQILDMLQDIHYAPDISPERLQANLSRRMIKPAGKDLLLFNDEIQDDPERIFQGYDDEDSGPYLLRLYVQLLLDAVHFLLAHELSHYLLGHHLAELPGSMQALAEEAQTDKRALEITRAVRGFELRSLLTLFAFCASQESDIPPHEMTHPFSRDRILLLAAAVLGEPGGDALRLDVNAGMSMLTSPLPGLGYQVNWGDGPPEMCDVIIHQYADMDYNAHLLFYLERPPREAEIQDGGKENAYLLSLNTLLVSLALRDRLHPEKIHFRASVSLRPGPVLPDLLFVYQQDRVLTRLHVRIPGPPDWWLEYPDAELVVEEIAPAPEALPERADAQGSFSHNILYQIDTAFDHERFVQSLPEPAPGQEPDPLACATVRLAARRFFEISQPLLALYYYNWLYRFQPGWLQYEDQINICYALLGQERYEDLEAVARSGLGAGRQLRPGFHIFLSAALSQRGEVPEAFEHAFLEGVGIGEYGEYKEFAVQAYYENLTHPTDPLMALMRKYHRHYQAAEALVARDKNKALKRYTQAWRAIDAACRLAQADFLFLREYAAEVRMDICRLEGSGFASVRPAFEAIVAREPQFLPARIQLARIALEEGDVAQARAIWQEARALMPFLNHFVYQFRELFDQPNPNFTFTSTPVSDAFRHPSADDSPPPVDGNKE